MHHTSFFGEHRFTHHEPIESPIPKGSQPPIEIARVGVIYEFSEDDFALQSYYARERAKSLKMIEEMTDAIDRNPNDHRALSIRGGHYLRLGKVNDALLDLRKSLALWIADKTDPIARDVQIPLLHLDIGECLRIKGDAKGSLKSYEECFKLLKKDAPELPEFYYRRGLALKDAGDKEKAFADFMKIFEFKLPDGSPTQDPRPYRELGKLMGDTEMARDYLRWADALDEKLRRERIEIMRR